MFTGLLRARLPSTLAVFVVSTSLDLLRRVEPAVPASGLSENTGKEPIDGESGRGVVRGEAPVVLEVVGGRDEEARHEPSRRVGKVRRVDEQAVE